MSFTNHVFFHAFRFLPLLSGTQEPSGPPCSPQLAGLLGTSQRQFRSRFLSSNHPFPWPWMAKVSLAYPGRAL